MQQDSRYFIRFGELPADGRSRMWASPHAHHGAAVGSHLPGISVYEVRRAGATLEMDTEPLNVGSGRASLGELLYRHATDQSLPIYLLTGIPVRWSDLDEGDQEAFEAFWPGDGAEDCDLAGTDGEPMLRSPEVVSSVSIMDIVCQTMNFPEEYEELMATQRGPGQ